MFDLGIFDIREYLVDRQCVAYLILFNDRTWVMYHTMSLSPLGLMHDEFECARFRGWELVKRQ